MPRIPLLLFMILCTAMPSVLFAEPLSSTPIRPAYRVVTLTGFTRAVRTMTVTPEVSARCLTVSADIGDPIPDNGVLAELDTTFTDLDLRRTSVAVQQAASRSAYLKKEVERSRELVRRDTQARAELDRIEQDLEQAGLTLADLRVSGTILAERKARHTLRGPAGWTVISREMEPGEWIKAGTPVARLGDFRTLRIPLALSSDELTALKSADKLRIALPEHDMGLPASIFRVSPDFDPKTRKTGLELLVEPPRGTLRGGVRCELSLSIPEPENTWLIPETSLYERYEAHWVAREDGTEVRVILLGPSGDGLVRVSSEELAPGDRIRVRP